MVGYRDVGYLVGVKGCIYTYSISVSSVVTLQALYPPNYPYTGIFQYSKIPLYSCNHTIQIIPYILGTVIIRQGYREVFRDILYLYIYTIPVYTSISRCVLEVYLYI